MDRKITLTIIISLNCTLTPLSRRRAHIPSCINVPNRKCPLIYSGCRKPIPSRNVIHPWRLLASGLTIPTIISNVTWTVNINNRTRSFISANSASIPSRRIIPVFEHSTMLRHYAVQSNSDIGKPLTTGYLRILKLLQDSFQNLSQSETYCLNQFH